MALSDLKGGGYNMKGGGGGESSTTVCHFGKNPASSDPGFERTRRVNFFGSQSGPGRTGLTGCYGSATNACCTSADSPDWAPMLLARLM